MELRRGRLATRIRECKDALHHNRHAGWVGRIHLTDKSGGHMFVENIHPHIIGKAICHHLRHLMHEYRYLSLALSTAQVCPASHLSPAEQSECEAIMNS